jgi:phosphodiesterase/alkaline phosphatase D-like protein
MLKSSKRRSYRLVDRLPNRAVSIAVRLNLTLDQLEELLQAASATWQVIGSDVLNCEGKGDSALMTQSEVIEVVLDADHILTNNRKLSVEVKAVLSHTRTFDAYWLTQALKLAFPYAKYGM